MHVRCSQLGTDTAVYVSDSPSGMSKRKTAGDSGQIDTDMAHQKKPNPICFYPNFKSAFAYIDVCVCVSHQTQFLITPSVLASIPTLIYIYISIPVYIPIYTQHTTFPSLIYIFLWFHKYLVRILYISLDIWRLFSVSGSMSTSAKFPL